MEEHINSVIIRQVEMQMIILNPLLASPSFRRQLHHAEKVQMARAMYNLAITKGAIPNGEFKYD